MLYIFISDINESLEARTHNSCKMAYFSIVCFVILIYIIIIIIQLYAPLYAVCLHVNVS